MTSEKSHFVFVRMFGISLSYIVVYMEAGAVFPMGLLDTDPAHWHSRVLDAAVSSSYHSTEKPNLDVPACPGAGLPPLGGEANVQLL